MGTVLTGLVVDKPPGSWLTNHMSTTHEPVITTLGPNSFRPIYQASCSCGWYAGLYNSTRAARDDHTGHKAEIAR